MVYCCVVGCCSISGRDKVRFFQVPSVINNQCDRTRELSMQRRMLWLKRINRKNLKDKNVTRDTKVCDRHFISGIYSGLIIVIIIIVGLMSHQAIFFPRSTF